MRNKKTTRGKTISVTLPLQLEKELQKEATDIGISRSRFIANILLDWQATKEGVKAKMKKTPSKVPAKNDCTIKDKNNFCPEYQLVCLAGKESASTCESYSPPGEK